MLCVGGCERLKLKHSLYIAAGYALAAVHRRDRGGKAVIALFCEILERLDVIVDGLSVLVGEGVALGFGGFAERQYVGQGLFRLVYADVKPRNSLGTVVFLLSERQASVETEVRGVLSAVRSGDGLIIVVIREIRHVLEFRVAH